jgi:hypothetical protein
MKTWLEFEVYIFLSFPWHSHNFGYIRLIQLSTMSFSPQSSQLGPDISAEALLMHIFSISSRATSELARDW